MAEETNSQTMSNEEALALVQNMVQEQVKSYLETQQPVQTQPVQTQGKTEQDYVREYVSPVIENNPKVNDAWLGSNAAMDAFNFYLGAKDGDDRLEYKDKIEHVFQELVRKGRPTGRNDIYRWILGHEYASDPTKFESERAERKKAALERASFAGDFGGSGLSNGRGNPGPTLAEFEKMTSDEQFKVLDAAGVTF